MPKLPQIVYDPEIEIDGYIETRIGTIKLWFACCDGGDALIAYQMNERAGKTCLNPLEGWPEELKELALKFPGRRCARQLDYHAFVAAWHADTDKLFYPKRIGKIHENIDLDANTPLDILADWLQDKGLDTAAQVLRASMTQSSETATK
jgi:hypothetical protein